MKCVEFASPRSEPLLSWSGSLGGTATAVHLRGKCGSQGKLVCRSQCVGVRRSQWELVEVRGSHFVCERKTASVPVSESVSQLVCKRESVSVSVSE